MRSLSTPRKLWSPLRRGGRAFARDRRGVTAVEFGLLGLPFFAIIGAILETSMVFLAGQILDSAVQDSSRLILTGRAEAAGFTDELFRDAICDRLYGLFTCDNLKVKVSVVSDFNSATVNSPVDEEGEGDWTIEESYDDGLGSSIVLVQAYYKWPLVINNLLGFTLQTQPDGTHLLGAVRVFKNEPF